MLKIYIICGGGVVNVHFMFTKSYFPSPNFTENLTKAANETLKNNWNGKVQSNSNKYLIDQSEEGIRRLVSCNLGTENCCMYMYICECERVVSCSCACGTIYCSPISSHIKLPPLNSFMLDIRYSTHVVILRWVSLNLCVCITHTFSTKVFIAVKQVHHIKGIRIRHCYHPGSI